MSGKTTTTTEQSPLVRCKLLKDQVADKSLFICTFELYEKSIPTTRYVPGDFSYVVRSISLPDLLFSEKNPELREVARLDDNGLPGEPGCGVLGSKIDFASGLKPNPNPEYYGPYGPDSSTDAYAFDVLDPNQGIVKLPGELNGGKQNPLSFEFNGKFYVLWWGEYKNFVSFEVFDSQQGTWSVLPKYPNYGYNHSYAVAGTKLFISTPVPENQEYYFRYYLKQDPSICCFDLAAARGAEWRRVPRMCHGGPFPFTGRALVVDLEHSNKKLVFSYKQVYGFVLPNILLVHLMSLDENREDITEITEMNLPVAATNYQRGDCHFFHLGGNNVCIVTTRMRKPEKKYEADQRGMIYTVQGAAIPFQFEFDVSKVDKDMKNCFTVQFQTPRIFEYHLRPDSVHPPQTLGCFVL